MQTLVRNPNMLPTYRKLAQDLYKALQSQQDPADPGPVWRYLDEDTQGYFIRVAEQLFANVFANIYVPQKPRKRVSQNHGISYERRFG